MTQRSFVFCFNPPVTRLVFLPRHGRARTGIITIHELAVIEFLPTSKGSRRLDMFYSKFEGIDCFDNWHTQAMCRSTIIWQFPIQFEGRILNDVPASHM